MTVRVFRSIGGQVFATAFMFVGLTVGAGAGGPDSFSASDCDPQEFSVAVDIGHTAEAPGATSARGRDEFSFNKALGYRLAALLKKTGFDTTVIEVSGGGSVQLKRRIARANALKPDLLISIHHDSVQPQYLSPWTHEGETLRYTDEISGYSLFVSRRNPRYRESLRFARLLGQGFQRLGLAYSPHHAEPIKGENRPLVDRRLGVYAFDDLQVLKKITMPAVLIEAGVIVNRDEELALSQPKRRDLMAKSIVKAVMLQCSAGEPAPRLDTDARALEVR